ncbi:4-(cytidine 5'-diphospho)-2-C-methyl-D-erythritol kinase [Candidatus Peregrinibacteria bacterium]|jgi:4-diphosphocytidyl-2-C-methyl-D-erythritol kinase|nr:4-(cytidine 5'-diphospho)-2-C-methyl-D-erythritol kinase [Candidatus Peregrinibacteria bacterium]
MPKIIEITAPAKVNLCLDIIKKDTSGYHEIQTIYFMTDFLKDTLKIFESKESSHTSIADEHQNSLIKMEDNLAHKALMLFKKTFKVEENACVEINKNIPLSAGLGGASTDAAAVLKGLNSLWGLGLAVQELTPLAEELGADVPLFLYAEETNVALGTHFGEKITPLPRLDLGIQILLEKEWPALPITDLSYKTGQMYESLDLSKCGHNTEKTAQALKAIKINDVEVLKPLIHNDFETLIAPPKGFHFSGSGPALFFI